MMTTTMMMTMSEKWAIPRAFLKKRAISIEFRLTAHSYYLFSVFFISDFKFRENALIAVSLMY